MLPTLIYGWMSFTYSLPLPTWPAKFFASKKQWAADRTVQESKMVPPHQWFPLPSHTPLALLSSLFNPCLIDTCHGIFDGASFPPTIRSALLKKLGMDAAKWKNRIGNLYQIVNYFKYTHSSSITYHMFQIVSELNSMVGLGYHLAGLLVLSIHFHYSMVGLDHHLVDPLVEMQIQW